MHKISKERLRRILGVREPKDPPDPEVIARRGVHEAIAKWELKWLTKLHIISAVLAFLVVLLPAFSDFWLGLVSKFSLLFIHDDFSSFGFISRLFFIVGLPLYVYTTKKIDGEVYSEYGYPFNLSNVRTPENIVHAELYPRTKIEEKIFFIDSFMGIWIATILWFLIFGGIAFIFTLGGI